MMNFSIGEIAAACGGSLVLQSGVSADCCISSAVLDSRKVEKDSLFFAVPGERVDGHKFISQVFANGALLAVTEKTPEAVASELGVETDGWGSYLLVENTLEALKKIAEAYRIKTGVPVVGITGSVGKTSTKEFIAGVLAQKYNVLKTEGNFNNEIGVPLTLLRIRPETELAVVEMGISDFGEMHRLSRMARPNVCVMTNIGQCHLENLKTRDGILKAKSEIFDFMAEDGTICLNGEDDKLASVSEVKGIKPHFFGLENKSGEVYAEEIQSHGLFGSDAVLNIKGERLAVQVPLPGRHMVLNAAAAACVAVQLGLSLEEIARGIASVTPVSGRNNLIRTDRITLIDDCYNANPASMRAAIDLLTMADTVKVAVLGDMFELGENSDLLHAGVGRYAAEKKLDCIYCIGENAQNMYDEAEEAVEGTCHLAYFPTRDAFLAAIAEEREAYIPDGATVLVKASHGMEFGRILDALK